MTMHKNTWIIGAMGNAHGTLVKDKRRYQLFQKNIGDVPLFPGKDFLDELHR